MKKKALWICACAGLLGLSAAALIATNSSISGTLAENTAHTHSSSCTIHHYKQVNPTSTASGVKEYWVCCANHETMFTAPGEGNITTEAHDDKFTINTDDDRYIAPYVIPFDFNSGSISVTSNSKPATGIFGGYDGKVYTIKINETHNGAGGTYLFLGSYGFYLRGDQIRLANRNSGSFAETSPRTLVDPGFSQKNWKDKDAIVGLAATIKDDATITLGLYYNYVELAHYDFARVSGEISSADAKFEVGIGDSSYVSRCDISSPEA